jgi:hypothetical protein
VVAGAAVVVKVLTPQLTLLYILLRNPLTLLPGLRGYYRI